MIIWKGFVVILIVSIVMSGVVYVVDLVVNI